MVETELNEVFRSHGVAADLSRYMFAVRMQIFSKANAVRRAGDRADRISVRKSLYVRARLIEESFDDQYSWLAAFEECLAFDRVVWGVKTKRQLRNSACISNKAKAEYRAIAVKKERIRLDMKRRNEIRKVEKELATACYLHRQINNELKELLK